MEEATEREDRICWPPRRTCRALTRDVGVVGLGTWELGACPRAGYGCFTAVELLRLHYCGYIAAAAWPWLNGCD